MTSTSLVSVRRLPRGEWAVSVVVAHVGSILHVSHLECPLPYSSDSLVTFGDFWSVLGLRGFESLHVASRRPQSASLCRGVLFL